MKTAHLSLIFHAKFENCRFSFQIFLWSVKINFEKIKVFWKTENWTETRPKNWKTEPNRNRKFGFLENRTETHKPNWTENRKIPNRPTTSTEKDWLLTLQQAGLSQKTFHRVADGTDLAMELHRASELQSEYSQLQGHPIGFLYGEEKSCRIMRVSNHCYDSQNQPACNYNFGDCCRPYVDRTHCAECICWEDGTVHPGQIFVDNIDDALFGYCTGLWIGNTYYIQLIWI